jgi:hypothetical protein
MTFAFLGARKMDFDTTTLTLGGIVVLLLFAVPNLYSTFRTNGRYRALGAKPPAVVSSDLLGITCFQALKT